MEIEPWEDLYEDYNDWYSVFVTSVRRKFETWFLVVQVSRKRLKDKAWVTKGLKISIKTNHRLYRSTLRETDPLHIIKYKTYKNELKLRKKNITINCLTILKILHIIYGKPSVLL